MPTLTEISQQQKDREEDALRIEFAKAALTGLLAGKLYLADMTSGIPTHIGNAQEAFHYADAMIAAMKAPRK